MRIGSCLSNGDQQATLGCFVFKNGGPKKLYAIVSRHAFREVGDAVFKKNKKVGFVSEVTPDMPPIRNHEELDAALVELDDNLVRKLEARAFTVRRNDKDLVFHSVFDPSSYREVKVRNAELPPQLKAMHLMVWHCGQKSEAFAKHEIDKFAYNEQFGVIAISDMVDNTYIFSERHNRPGDSGGPIYRDSGELVGFNGGGSGKVLPTEKFGKGTTDKGFYRLAHDVFTHFGVTLATWANRADWLPPNPVKEIDPFGDDDGAIAWVDPWAIKGKK
jgi:hypothetical protein